MTARPSSCNASMSDCSVSNKSMSYMSTSNDLSIVLPSSCHCQVVPTGGIHQFWPNEGTRTTETPTLKLTHIFRFFFCVLKNRVSVTVALVFCGIYKEDSDNNTTV